VLADGIELVGEYEDSGFKEPPLLARRADGQMIQLTRLLYLVAEAADGRDEETVAEIVSERFGRRVSADNVRFLADEQLRPLGVLALRDGTTPELPKREALFALRCRRPILAERTVNGIARMLTWLHRPPVVLLALLAIAAFDGWLFGIHGIAQPLRAVIYEPTLLLAVLCSTIIAAAWHESGHASACRYGGARPGVVGVGLYLVWPAFYCDVTDAYRLNRKGRLRTDLGGVYFNALFALGAGVAYFATRQEAFLLVAFVQHMVILQQLIPLLRFDGYYVLSDLTGVPDILSRIKPIFRSLVRGRRNEPRVDELKRWVRVAVTAYLIALIPTLAFMFGSTVMSAPRIFATVADSLALQVGRVGNASGFAEVALAIFRIGALILPPAAIALSLGRSGRMAVRGLARWSRGSVTRRCAVVALLAAVAGAVAYTWWPNGDYQPIRRGERGTVGEAVRAIPDFKTGRPSFTKERERRYGPEPTERETETGAQRAAPSDDPASTPTPTPGGDPTRDASETARDEPTPDDTAAPAQDDTPEPDDTATPTTTATPDPSRTPTPVPTATAPAETATPTSSTATSTDTATPTTTATPEPTITPTATVSATSTPEVTSTPAATEPATTDAAAETASPTAEPAPADPTSTPTP
jgi:putative peptide zinc metalloprotease protein